MKKGILLIVISILLYGCANTTGYIKISPEEAKQRMDTEDCIIIDARTPEEYNTGHIPGAIVVSEYDDEEEIAQILPDKTQQILVYCRSRNRSKKAAEALLKMGYTYVIDFGGILDWPYETE